MAQPNRRISWPLRLYILVGGALPLLWAAFTIGTVVVAHNTVLPDGAPLFGPSYDRIADGIIVRVEKTNTEILNKPVIAVDAIFIDDVGAQRTIRSYESTTTLRSVDSRVRVHYLSKDRDTAVIDGMRTHVTPWWLVPAMYIFMAGFAAAPALFGLGKRRRALALLRHGEHAVGTIVGVQEHGKGEDREDVATIEISTGAKESVRVEGRSHKDGFFTVGHFESVVYDAASPQHATLLRQLPGKPVIDGNDHVRFG